jgi:mRNA interferase RelE/StbE
MKVEYSRQFEKAAYLLTGKYKESLKKIISDVKTAKSIADVPGCSKLVSFKQSYRIRMGDYRLILLHKIENDTIIFELLVSRVEIYNKENEKLLRRKERE